VPLRRIGAILPALGLTLGLGLGGAGCGGDEATASAPAPLRYAIELVPGKDSPLVRQQLPSLPIDADGGLALMLGAPATISGRVVATAGTDASMSAHLSAEPIGDPTIPGRPLVFETAAAAGVAPNQDAFQLAVVPGPYDLHVTPDLPDMPPFVVREQLLADRVIEIAAPARNDLVKVSGRVLDGIGVGVASMQVRVVGSGGETVSTTATTDGDGAFYVFMPKVVGTYTVRAQPTAEWPLPAAEQRLTVDAQSGPEVVAFVRLPRFNAVQSYDFQVVARSASGSVRAVMGARLAFAAVLIDPDGVVATFSATALTDASGSASAVLVPGARYSATVRTPPDSEFAGLVIDGLLLDQRRFELGPRSAVTGTIYGADSQPVANAALQVLAIGADANGSGPAVPVTTSAASYVSDAHGRYRVLVDPGSYDLEVAPPEGSPYPRWASEQVTLGAGAEVTVDVRLPPARRVSGRVTGPGGTGLADVDVRVFVLSQTGSARLRGEARSDKTGGFTLVLPSLY
jgi:hypothetical protein